MQRPWVFIIPVLFSILATLINPSNLLNSYPKFDIPDTGCGGAHVWRTKNPDCWTQRLEYPMEYVLLMMRCIVARDALAHASGQEMPCPALQRELGIFPVFVAVETAERSMPTIQNGLVRCVVGKSDYMDWLGIQKKKRIPVYHHLYGENGWKTPRIKSLRFNTLEKKAHLLFFNSFKLTFTHHGNSPKLSRLKPE